MLNRFFFLFVAIIIFPLNVIAGDTCDNTLPQTDLNICAGLSYEKADGELNRVYQKALRILSNDESRTESFKIIQRSWIVYRDNNCKYETSLYEGGSIAPLIYASCMERLTKARISEIPNSFQEWEMEE